MLCRSSGTRTPRFQAHEHRAVVARRRFLAQALTSIMASTAAAQKSRNQRPKRTRPDCSAAYLSLRAYCLQTEGVYARETRSAPHTLHLLRRARIHRRDRVGAGAQGRQLVRRQLDGDAAQHARAPPPRTAGSDKTPSSPLFPDRREETVRMERSSRRTARAMRHTATAMA